MLKTASSPCLAVSPLLLLFLLLLSTHTHTRKKKLTPLIGQSQSLWQCEWTMQQGRSPTMHSRRHQRRGSSQTASGMAHSQTGIGCSFVVCCCALCCKEHTHTHAHTHTKEKIARARTREGSEDGSRCKQHDKTKRSKKQEARSTHTRAHTTKINKVANDTLRFEIDLRVIKREHTPTHLNLAHAQQSLTCGLRHVSVAAAAKRTHTHTRPNRSGATTRMRNKVKPL